jgi:4-alpha-glucanotransferase
LPREGAYVDYPLQDLLGIVALESQRHRCLVIGEDLGTVEPQFREQMCDAGILSYRVLGFERTPDGHFLPADAYPTLALAVAGNHDLPTLRGWWEGRDIQLKARMASGSTHEEEAQREIDRARLLELLGCAAAGTESVTVEEVVALVHSFLRETPCLLSMAQLDDLAGEADPVNLPGTLREYPNWRRRLGLNLESLLARTEGAPSARLRELRPASPRVS